MVLFRNDIMLTKCSGFCKGFFVVIKVSESNSERYLSSFLKFSFKENDQYFICISDLTRIYYLSDGFYVL